MNEFRKVAVRTALESGRIIKRSVGKVTKVAYKGRDNIVTDVDKRSEDLIIRRITSSFPNHSILSEESSPRIKDSPYRWIIDPLDGTTNFAHAFPFFCVSIGLEFNGEIVLGVIYDPMRDELFMAEKGKGALLNGKKIRVSRVKDLSTGFLATGFSYGINSKDRNIKYFKDLLVMTQAIRRAGSAALDLCYVACARFDGFWEMNLHPWDSAAGYLVVSEAGGVVTRFNGTAYTPYDNDILATNGLLHDQMIKILTK